MLYASIMSHRTQITLTDELYARLLAESRRSGVALDELVCRALDRVYGSASSEDILRALEESFGAWSERTFDGESYVECLRRGMARRLTD